MARFTAFAVAALLVLGFFGASATHLDTRTVRPTVADGFGWGYTQPGIA